jgi:hypothetical protein
MLADLLNQTVTVETRTGAGAYGEVYAAPTDVSCFLSEVTRTVRDSKGTEVVSSTTLYAPLAAAPDPSPSAGQFAVGSRVTVAGRTAYVIQAARQNAAGPITIHHTSVHLT